MTARSEGPVTIAGPTCDSTDTLYEKSNYRLPLALTCGDRVELLATGAYVTTYASQVQRLRAAGRALHLSAGRSGPRNGSEPPRNHPGLPA
jgi:diaminopimelate decarboxylase